MTTDDADESWHHTDVTVTLTADDEGSGVQSTQTSVDGEPRGAAGAVTVAAPAVRGKPARRP